MFKIQSYFLIRCTLSKANQFQFEIIHIILHCSLEVEMTIAQLKHREDEFATIVYQTRKLWETAVSM